MNYMRSHKKVGEYDRELLRSQTANQRAAP